MNEFDHAENPDMLALLQEIEDNDGLMYIPSFYVGKNEYIFLHEKFLHTTKADAICSANDMESILPMVQMVADVEPTGRVVPFYESNINPEKAEEENPEYILMDVGHINAGLLSGPLYEEFKRADKAGLN